MVQNRSYIVYFVPSSKDKVCKLDVDQAMDIAMSYGVASIPTLILFKDGEIVKKSVGVVSKTEIEAMWS